MSTRRAVVSFAIALLALAGLVGVQPGNAQDAQASEQPEPSPAAVAPEIPREARDRVNPVLADEGSLERGGMLFSSQCTMCHGAAGDGTGSLVDRLKLEMPDFTNAKRQGQRTDGELFFILSEGHGRMPGQADRFLENTKWDLVNYVRQFARKK